jgi:hypothetical protein
MLRKAVKQVVDDVRREEQNTHFLRHVLGILVDLFDTLKCVSYI